MDCTTIFCDTTYLLTFSSVCLREEKQASSRQWDAKKLSALPQILSPFLPPCVLALTGSSVVSSMALAWQQMTAILIKRFHHSRRDWKGLISQILLPVLFMVFAMGLGSIKNDLQHYPELELSPALYNFAPSYSFFRSVPTAKKIRGSTEVNKANQGAFPPSMFGAVQSNPEALLFYFNSFGKVRPMPLRLRWPTNNNIRTPEKVGLVIDIICLSNSKLLLVLMDKRGKLRRHVLKCILLGLKEPPTATPLQLWWRVDASRHLIGPLGSCKSGICCKMNLKL